MPLTFKLFDLAGISIELFAAYARRADVLRKGGKKSVPEKLFSLSDFVDNWVDHSDPVHSLIWDLMRHERAILELQASIESPAVARDCRSIKVCLQSVPIQRRTVIHHEMSCNVVELARTLRAGANQIPLLSRGHYYFSYRQGSDDAHMDVLEIDAIGSVIVDLSDGHRTIGEIGSVLGEGGIRLSAEDLCYAVRQLVTNRLLGVDGGSGA